MSERDEGISMAEIRRALGHPEKPRKYYRRPQEVEAVRWDGTQEHAKTLASLVTEPQMLYWFVEGSPSGEKTYLSLDASPLITPERHSKIRPISADHPGDVLVFEGTVVKVMAPDEFEALYEPAPAPSARQGAMFTASAVTELHDIFEESAPPVRQGEAFRQGWDKVAAAALDAVQARADEAIEYLEALLDRSAARCLPPVDAQSLARELLEELRRYLQPEGEGL